MKEITIETGEIVARFHKDDETEIVSDDGLNLLYDGRFCAMFNIKRVDSARELEEHDVEVEYDRLVGNSDFYEFVADQLDRTIYYLNDIFHAIEDSSYLVKNVPKIVVAATKSKILDYRDWDEYFNNYIVWEFFENNATVSVDTEILPDYKELKKFCEACIGE